MTAPVLRQLHGLVVASPDVDLDARPAPAGSAPDVVLELGDTGPVTPLGAGPDGTVLAHVDHDGQAQLSVTRHRTPAGGTEVHVDFHGLARATVDERAERVRLHFADAGADRSLAPVLLGGTVMSVLLHLRGHPVLHASAVTTRTGDAPVAIGVVGRSGMGKSTLATLLARDGADFLTDDVLRTDVDGERVVAWPGATAVRLRSAAASLAGTVDGPSRTTADGRTAVELPAGGQDAVSLRALVVPRPDRVASAVEVRRLGALEGFAMLSRFPRILGWVDPDLAGRLHRHLGDVANRVPIYLATVPWGPPFAPGLGAAVLDAVATG